MIENHKELSYELRAFWRGRGESPEECAHRLFQTLSSLARIHEALENWYGPVAMALLLDARDRGLDIWRTEFPRERFCRMPPEELELTRIVRDGVSMKDVPEIPWPEMGYRFGASSGKMIGEFASFIINAGASYDGSPSINSAQFVFGGVGGGEHDLVAAPLQREIMLHIVAAWQPDWASLGPQDYTPPCTINENPFARPWGGWMTYLARPWADRITPPRTVDAARTPDGGWFMQATDEQFLLDNPSHVARADAIDAAMAPIRW